jgi:hypothetical protein
MDRISRPATLSQHFRHELLPGNVHGCPIVYYIMGDRVEKAKANR